VQQGRLVESWSRGSGPRRVAVRRRALASVRRARARHPARPGERITGLPSRGAATIMAVNPNLKCAQSDHPALPRAHGSCCETSGARPWN